MDEDEILTRELAAGPADGARWHGSSNVSFPEYPHTVAGLLHHAIRHHADSLAVADPAGSLTYGDLERRSAALAARLVELGVGKGSRVGTLLPNGIEWVIAWAAITRIGAVSTPVNTFYTTPELATMLRHADVQVLIASPSFGPHDYLGRLLEIAPDLAAANPPHPLMLRELPQLRHVLLWDTREDIRWATSGIGDDLDEPVTPLLADVVAGIEHDVSPADPMLITYTSGSSGEPKGVVHGHGPLLRHAHNMAAMSGIGPEDRIWTPMPLCWVGGFSFTLLRALSVGAAFITQPTADSGVALELLERHRVTCVSAWPNIGAALREHPRYPSSDLSSLRLGMFAEARPAHLRPADLTLCVTSLGMSETAGPHTFWTAEDDRHGIPEQYRGAFGHQIPGMEHRIVDADGNDCPEGVEGEVLVRGYPLMLGFHKRERARVFDRDGWYHTDDRGYFRDGWFFFTGRQSDLIKTKGANVSPAEVEAALLTCPGVRAAYVSGVDHPERGQDVVALVVLDDADDSATAITSTDTHARAGTHARPDTRALGPLLQQILSSYKVPRHIFEIRAGDVPYLTSQKPDRRALMAMAAELSRHAPA